ncbi:MAG: chromate transporter, partial [Lysobacter sp.]
MPSAAPQFAAGPNNASEVFRVFLRLGLTSFGGPIAHLTYFREEFVTRRGWLDEARFAQLLSLCQFLPGPASSQMGFAIGLFRGGWLGALAAFAAFTLPSALLMLGFATLSPFLDEGLGAAAVHGLKLVAVVVVAHGLVGMVRQLTPDVPRALIAIGAVALIVLTGNAWVQLIAIALGGMFGVWLCRGAATPTVAVFAIPYGHRGGVVFFTLFL